MSITASTFVPPPCCFYLDKADVLGVFSKALTADVQVVLADDTPLVATYSAAAHKTSHFCHITAVNICNPPSQQLAKEFSARSDLAKVAALTSHESPCLRLDASSTPRCDPCLRPASGCRQTGALSNNQQRASTGEEKLKMHAETLGARRRR